MIVDINPESHVRYTDIFPGVVDTYEYSPCAYDQYFAAEAKKPYHLRSGYCMLVCQCDKCSRRVIM